MALLLGPPERMLGVTGPPANNSGDLTVGARFNVLTVGVITHIRYWHVACASVTHKQALWRWSGSAFVRVASVSSVPAGFTGFYEVALPTPVSVAAGETYMAANSWDNTDGGNALPKPTSLSPNLTWVNAFYGVGSDVLPVVTFGEHLFVDVVYRTTSPMTA